MLTYPTDKIGVIQSVVHRLAAVSFAICPVDAYPKQRYGRSNVCYSFVDTRAEAYDKYREGERLHLLAIRRQS